jgi:6-hydroxycyclohex-1-ene-1-carbonyl-CoA dehydrogenase
LADAPFRWWMTAPGEPMAKADFDPFPPSAGEVVVEVAGCGVCHTDLGFYYDGVRVKSPLPLTLGHEISGRVVAAGAGAERWQGKAVIVPSVIPCGECELCASGHGTICRRQQMPGNDISVVADAVTTPYQAIVQAEVRPGDFAVVVGVGGVGGYAVQIARAFGATVAALDVDPLKLSAMAANGAAFTVNVREVQGRDLKKAVQEFARKNGCPDTRWKIFECSGTAAGQDTAFGLLNHGATLSVVGFTMDKVELRLSNLMAFHARAVGNWGCLIELYPRALDLALDGKIAMAPFVERHPLNDINEVFAAARAHKLTRRAILVPGR